MSGGDPRYLNFGQTGCRGAYGAHQHARQTRNDRLDNGTEFTSNAILGWAKDHRVEWHYIAPGKPMQNGYIESFNGRMRDELLNESLFMDLDQARQLIGAWIADYNIARPHSSLGYKTPAAYAGTLTAPKGVTLAEALTAAG